MIYRICIQNRELPVMITMGIVMYFKDVERYAYTLLKIHSSDAIKNNKYNV